LATRSNQLFIKLKRAVVCAFRKFIFQPFAVYKRSSIVISSVFAMCAIVLTGLILFIFFLITTLIIKKN